MEDKDIIPIQGAYGKGKVYKKMGNTIRKNSVAIEFEEHAARPHVFRGSRTRGI